MNTILTTVVLSGWRATQDLIANVEANNKIRATLSELNVKHWDAVGAYKEDGQALISQEVSIIAHCRNLEDMAKVKQAAWDSNQDSVLSITEYNQAFLVFPDDSCQHIGELKQVSEDKAKDAGIYTYFLGEYYIVE